MPKKKLKFKAHSLEELCEKTAEFDIHSTVRIKHLTAPMSLRTLIYEGFSEKWFSKYPVMTATITSHGILSEFPFVPALITELSPAQRHSLPTTKGDCHEA
jgi:hypothetical protein